MACTLKLPSNEAIAILQLPSCNKEFEQMVVTRNCKGKPQLEANWYSCTSACGICTILHIPASVHSKSWSSTPMQPSLMYKTSTHKITKLAPEAASAPPDFATKQLDDARCYHFLFSEWMSSKSANLVGSVWQKRLLLSEHQEVKNRCEVSPVGHSKRRCPHRSPSWAQTGRSGFLFKRFELGFQLSSEA